MSRRNRRSGININSNPELDLKLNLSPPPPVAVGPHRMSTSSPEVSPPRSCVSSEESLKYSSSPETMSMVLVGCPRCLMYVMLSESDPRCPKCKSTVLLDFLNNDNDDNDDNNTKYGGHGGGGGGGGSSSNNKNKWRGRN